MSAANEKSAMASMMRKYFSCPVFALRRRFSITNKKASTDMQNRQMQRYAGENMGASFHLRFVRDDYITSFDTINTKNQ
ncbi:hypothetical protein SDC9_112764 [bioreactor metagenome]|uniref:Uncharacterized protein n=1 Tax=bioreactor metagenome TaxID=1076179 RepID=A0A645BK69_9ZZZZ